MQLGAGMSEELLHRSLDLIEAGKYEEAMENLKYYIKINPSNPDAFCALGLCYERNGDKDKGRQYIIKARSMGSNAAEELIESGQIKINHTLRSKIEEIGIPIVLLIGYFLYRSTLNITVTVFHRDILSAIFAAWQIFAAINLYKKSYFCLLNAKILLLVMLSLHLYLFINGQSRSFEVVCVSAIYAVYLFFSRSVENMYGDSVDSNFNKNLSKYKHTPTAEQQFADLKFKIISASSGVTIKAILIFISIVILISSIFVFKFGIDFKNSFENSEEFISSGDGRVYKINKRTGEKWLITPSGEYKIKQRYQSSE